MTTLSIGGVPVVSDPTVPRDMILLKQGGRITGAICKGVVFGTADIVRMQNEIARDLHAQVASWLGGG